MGLYAGSQWLNEIHVPYAMAYKLMLPLKGSIADELETTWLIKNVTLDALYEDTLIPTKVPLLVP